MSLLSDKVFLKPKCLSKSRINALKQLKKYKFDNLPRLTQMLCVYMSAVYFYKTPVSVGLISSNVEESFFLTKVILRSILMSKKVF